MASYNEGKYEIAKWILDCFEVRESIYILDVGACDGKWSDILRSMAQDKVYIDAVEAFQPNAAKLGGKYDKVFTGEIKDYDYLSYDVVIFGDVVEHMDVQTASYCLDYAKKRSKDIIVSVPFLYKQGAIYGNPYERHIQDDLTPELFAQRYKGFEVVLRPKSDYAYYHLKGGALDPERLNYER